MTSSDGTAPARMTAFRVPSAGAPPQWQDVPVPTPAPGQVLIKLAAAGVCGTDLEIIDHGAQFDPFVGPYTLGHENAGRIEALGQNVDAVRVGQNVVVNTVQTCGSCRNCRDGADNYCTRRRGVYGISRDGGFAPYMVARAQDVFDIGDLDPLHAAPLADAGATAYGAVNAIRPYLADSGSVLVLGVGGVGGLAVRLLKLLTAVRVIAVDRPAAHERARQAGADHVFAPDDAVAQIIALIGAEGVDAAIDIVGADSTLGIAAAVIRSRGRIQLVGTGHGTLSFGMGSPRGAASLEAQSTCSTRELVSLIRLAQRGLIDAPVTPYPIDRLEDAISDLRDGRLRSRAVVTFEREMPAPRLQPSRQQAEEVVR